MHWRKRSFESMYHTAQEESQLTWYSEDIPLFLEKAVESLHGKGNALDIGCGTGICSLFMAQGGLQVTALDRVAKALDLAGMKADKSGVTINFVRADVVEWKTNEKYDLIFDRGCLHSLKRKNRARYKEQILRLMSNHSDFVLLHFGKKHFFNLKIGEPVRKTPEEIELFFSPELKLKECCCEETDKGPLFHYWFNLKKVSTARLLG